MDLPLRGQAMGASTRPPADAPASGHAAIAPTYEALRGQRYTARPGNGASTIRPSPSESTTVALRAVRSRFAIGASNDVIP